MTQSARFFIREARAEDAAAARNLTLEAFQEYAGSMPPDAWSMYRENLIETLGRPEWATHIVAVEADTIIGSVFLTRPEMSEEEPEVRLLAVAPAARGRGVGRALMEDCVRRTRGEGHSALRLHTSDMMKAATRLYTQMGFVRAPDLDFSPMEGALVKGYRLYLG